jgi:small subunit ribosomal protein S17
MRQNFMGVVVGTAMQKTIKVRVMSQKVHPIVRKVKTTTATVGVSSDFRVV